MSKFKKDFKFFSYFNILNVFLSSLILFIPMMIYVSQYHSTDQLLDAGILRTTNLGVSISLIIVTSIMAILIYNFWFNDIKKLDYELSNKEFTWIVSTVAVSFISIILFTIAFFCIWLFPIHGNVSDINRINKIRLIAYASVFSILFVATMSASIFCVTWTNLRISYSINKDTYKNEEK